MITIDTDALQNAINEYEELLTKTQALYDEIEAMSKEIRSALKTPAGNQFSDSLDNCVLVPIKQQMTAIDFVKEELKKARTEYSFVFEEYAKVVRMTYISRP